MELHSWLHQQAGRVAGWHCTASCCCEQNQKKLSLGNTSFDSSTLKTCGSQIRIASEALWENFCSFLLCITSDAGSVLWAPFSDCFTSLRNSASSTDLLLPVFILEKVLKRLGDELSIYLFITNVSLTWQNVVSWKSLFLSFMLHLILRRCRRGFKGHLKSSLLLFDRPFTISLQFCFTKSSLLTTFVATAIFLGLQRNLRC